MSVNLENGLSGAGAAEAGFRGGDDGFWDDGFDIAGEDIACSQRGTRLDAQRAGTELMRLRRVMRESLLEIAGGFFILQVTLSLHCHGGKGNAPRFGRRLDRKESIHVKD
jgi:hypothetical protein